MTPYTRDAVLQDLRRKACESLRGVVDESSSVALVNYPDIGNVGDPALWLGTMELLKGLGIRPEYHIPRGSLDAGTIDRLRSVDVVLVNGGGNFGDLWPGQQQTREQVFEACADRRIVQLPQSLWYRDRQNLVRMAQLCQAASDLTLMWREKRSFDFARKVFHCRHMLVPDMAFALERVDRASRTEFMWLIRSDQESRFSSAAWQQASGGQVTDWMSDPHPDNRRLATTRKRLHEQLSREAPTETIETLMIDLASMRVERGFEILGKGRVVITDRLHGHIMSVLLGRPHVIVDNSYGKLFDSYRTWIDGLEWVLTASSPEDADRKARDLAIA